MIDIDFEAIKNEAYASVLDTIHDIGIASGDDSKLRLYLKSSIAAATLVVQEYHIQLLKAIINNSDDDDDDDNDPNTENGGAIIKFPMAKKQPENKKK